MCSRPIEYSTLVVVVVLRSSSLCRLHQTKLTHASFSRIRFAVRYTSTLVFVNLCVFSTCTPSKNYQQTNTYCIQAVSVILLCEIHLICFICIISTVEITGGSVTIY